MGLHNKYMLNVYFNNPQGGGKIAIGSWVKEQNSTIMRGIEEIERTDPLMGKAMRMNVSFLCYRGGEEDPFHSDWLEHGDCCSRVFATYLTLLHSRSIEKTDYNDRHTKLCPYEP